MESSKNLSFSGRIMVADDQLINIEALKIHFNAFKIEKYCDYFINGQQIINAVKKEVEKAIQDTIVGEKQTLRPIVLMLLDF